MTTMAAVLIPRNNLDPKRLLRAVENTLTMTAKAVKVDFDTTTRTWKERPEFTIEKAPFERIVGTDSDIYRFVTRGTSIRYATMMPGFSPKTSVRMIGSSGGKGGVAFISKKHPKPGIKAREFEETIGTKWQKEMPAQMQRAIDAELAPR
jgi:hypothetical protein